MKFPRLHRNPKDAFEEVAFIEEAQTNSREDLEEVRGMRIEASEVSAELRDQTRRNHWAESVKQALGQS